jgi:hypothetical protein
MRCAVMNLMPLARSTCVVTLMLAVCAGSAAPAQAQDLLGFLRSLLPPALQNPFDPPPANRSRLGVEQRPGHPRPQMADIDQPTMKPPLKPKAPGEVTKAVPDLLTDSTLQHGDIVMFPDGPRAFVGHPGAQHALTDFEPMAQAGSAVSASTRKLIALLRPGSDSAWRAEQARSISGVTADAEGGSTFTR